jgi:hypothetical protein
MPQITDDPLAAQCGNCKFWDNIGRRDNGGECFGGPPGVVLLGMRPRAIGVGHDMQVEFVRPILASNARPCSLHQRNIIRMIGEHSEAVPSNRSN